MRSYNVNFAAKNRARTKEPRWVVELAWDFANSNLHYFTSHADAATPGGASVNANVIEGIGGTSQKLDPIQGRATIGAINVRLEDVAGALTSLFRTQLIAGNGLRGKRLRVYMGYAGDAWTDYELVQTQIVSGEVAYDQGTYTIPCADVQRSARQDIFDLATTTLTSSISDTATTVPVESTTGFEPIEHGLSYTDAPPYSTGTVSATNGSKIVNGTGTSWTGKALEGGRITIAGVDYAIDTINSNTQLTLLTNYAGATQGGLAYTAWPKVLYLRLGDEIIRCPAGGVQATQCTGCQRGVLGTKAVEHKVDPNADIKRRPKIEEVVYLELPAVKLALAVLTGDLYGQAGQTLPNKWQLAIDPTYVRTSDFTGIGADWWDTADDRNGVGLRFLGEKKQDGKRFLEQQIYQVLGAFTPIYRDGSLGLKRMTRVLSDAAHVRVLDESNIVDHGPLRHDQDAVHNQIRIDWNWDPIDERFTRAALLTDAASISKHGAAPVLELEARGLHGSRADQTTLAARFDSLRSRHVGPPELIQVQVLQSLNDLEVGDIVRLQHPRIRDYNGATAPVDRAFEVQSISIDWVTGKITLDLFGSSEAPGAIAPTDNPNPVSNPFYTTLGTELAGYLSANYPGAFSLVGDVGHIVANCTLPGNADMNAAGAIYYYNGSLQIDTGVTVTVDDNVQLRVAGYFQCDGTIDGKGRGIAGATTAETPGTPGFLGTTRAGGGIVFRWQSTEAPVAQGAKPAWYPLDLSYSGTTLRGIPSDLRGTSGGSGYDYRTSDGSTVYAAGGAGGAGGAGLAVICRGASFGVNGLIDLSGANGSAGAYHAGNQVYAGAGAGGAPGACLFLLDGALVDIPSNKLVAIQGATPGQGTPIPAPENIPNFTLGPVWQPALPASSYYQGDGALTASQRDHSAAWWSVQRIPETAAPQEDVPAETSKPLAVNLTELTNTPQTPAENLCTLEVSVTAPGDGNFLYANIYYRVAGSGGGFIPAGPATPEALIVVPMDGTNYEIIAKPVSIFYVESQDYATTTHQVPTATGGVTLGGGNYLRTSDTVGQATNGQGVVYDNTGFRGYDSTGTLKTVIDATTGKITAVDVDLSGTITATAGDIGDWTIVGGVLESASGLLVLDGLNGFIQAGPDGSNYTRLDDTGIICEDQTLGITFRVYTDGTPPLIAKGILREMTYEIYTSGVIRTSATVGDGSALSAGVLVNNTGIKAYGPNSSTPSVHINAADGKIYIAGVDGDSIASDAAAGATFTSSDAGALAYLNAADWATQISNIPEAQLYNIDDATALGFNPSFSDWTGATPTGWSAWINGPTKESVLVLSGKYAARFATNGAAAYGLIRNYNNCFSASPLPDGTFLLASFSYRLASYTSGTPGILVDLIVSADGATYRRTSIPIDKTTTGIWHRQVAVARMNPGDTLYGIRIYVIGSWSGFPGGNSNCDVIFDNVGFNILHASTLAYDNGTRIDDLKPSEAGADVTGNAIQTGVTLSSGSLTFQVGGIDTLQIDGVNKRIWINNGIYGEKGLQAEYNAGNPRIQIGNKGGGGNYIEFDGTNVNIKGALTSGSITASTFKTATSGARVEITTDGKIHFYGDGGAGLEQLALVGGGGFVAQFGSLMAGNAYIAVQALSESGIGVYARCETGYALYGYSPSAVGVHAGGSIPLEITGGTLSGSAANGSLDYASDRLQIRSASSWRGALTDTPLAQSSASVPALGYWTPTDKGLYTISDTGSVSFVLSIYAGGAWRLANSGYSSWLCGLMGANIGRVYNGDGGGAHTAYYTRG